jgi:hypothetical protein
MDMTRERPTLSHADLDTIAGLAETLSKSRPQLATALSRVHRWATTMRDVQTREQLGFDAELFHRMREVIGRYIAAVDEGRIKGGRTYLSFCRALQVEPRTMVDLPQPTPDGHDQLLDGAGSPPPKADMDELVRQLAVKLGGK